MPILYSMISDIENSKQSDSNQNDDKGKGKGKDSSILVDHTLEGISGNFRSVVTALLPRINTTTDNKLSYTYDTKYLIHYDVTQPYVYMCVSDAAFDRSYAFKFLRSVKSAFEIRYNVNTNNVSKSDSHTDDRKNTLPIASIANTEYNQFESTLRNLMYSVNDDYESADSTSRSSTGSGTGSTGSGSTALLYNNSTSTSTDGDIELQGNSSTKSKRYQPVKGSKLYDVRSNLNAMQPIIIDNIDRLMNRGERLELLVDKADQLEHGAMKFNRGSRGLKHQYMIENVRQWGIIIGCVALFILFCYALFD